jgi:hypothetical protein
VWDAGENGGAIGVWDAGDSGGEALLEALLEAVLVPTLPLRGGDAIGEGDDDSDDDDDSGEGAAVLDPPTMSSLSSLPLTFGLAQDEGWQGEGTADSADDAALPLLSFPSWARLSCERKSRLNDDTPPSPPSPPADGLSTPLD